jgi:hypothetical protein
VRKRDESTRWRTSKPHADNAEAVLKRADQAAYRAKDLGRDKCEVAKHQQIDLAVCPI